MGVLFAIGAVSGTILSFEFGILWPRWMGRFGDVMGLPFALEGFAFFLGAIFIVAGCLLPAPYAWAMLHGRRTRYERLGVLVPLTVALLAAPLQIVVGDWAG